MIINQRDRGFWGGATGGIFLIGVGLILLLNVPCFPWFLLLIGLISLPGSIATGGFWAGIQGFIWLAGLAILFASDTFWPGILILIGLSMVVGARIKPPMFSSSR